MKKEYLSLLRKFKKKIFKLSNRLLEDLKNEKKLVFIHIGKCGGTSTISSLKKNNKNIRIYHEERPPIFRSNKDKYFFIVRNPLARFVSAFNYSKSIIDFDLNSIKEDKLSLENCPAPANIRERIRNGIAFSKSYDNLINYFETANDLAESIYSSNEEIRKKARKLMLSKKGHIYKSIGWYLYNGKFIERKNDQIIFVGRLEYIDEDINNYQEKNRSQKIIFDNLKNENNKYYLNHIRKTNTIYSKDLSKVAIDNLKRWYTDNDYAALKMLLSYGWLDQEIYSEYQNYST